MPWSWWTEEDAEADEEAEEAAEAAESVDSDSTQRLAVFSTSPGNPDAAASLRSSGLGAPAEGFGR